MIGSLINYFDICEIGGYILYPPISIKPENCYIESDIPHVKERGVEGP